MENRLAKKSTENKENAEPEDSTKICFYSDMQKRLKRQLENDSSGQTVTIQAAIPACVDDLELEHMLQSISIEMPYEETYRPETEVVDEREEAKKARKQLFLEKLEAKQAKK